MERAKLSTIEKGGVYNIVDPTGKVRPGICLNNFTSYGVPFQFFEVTSSNAGRVLPVMLRDDNIITFVKCGKISYETLSDVKSGKGKHVSEDFMEMCVCMLTYSIGLPILRSTYEKIVAYLEDYNKMVTKGVFYDPHGRKVAPINIYEQVFNMPQVFINDTLRTEKAELLSKVPVASETPAVEEKPKPLPKVPAASERPETPTVKEEPEPIKKVAPQYYMYRSATKPVPVELLKQVPSWMVDILKEHYLDGESPLSSTDFNNLCNYVYRYIHSSSDNKISINSIADKFGIPYSSLYVYCNNIEMVAKALKTKTSIETIFIRKINKVSKNKSCTKERFGNEFFNWLCSEETEECNAKQILVDLTGIDRPALNNFMIRSFGSSNKDSVIARIDLVNEVLKEKTAAGKAI